MKEEMQKKLFCKIVLITFFVAECTFKEKNVFFLLISKQMQKILKFIFDQFAPFSGWGGDRGSKSIALFGFSNYLQERLKFVFGLF